MSALGQKRTCAVHSDVRFVPIADMATLSSCVCPLRAARPRAFWLLLNKCFAGRTNTSDLNYYVTVFGPRKVRGFWRLGIERTGGISI